MGKKSKISVLRDEYNELPDKDSITLTEFIEQKSFLPGFWEWFFDGKYSGVITEEQEKKFQRWLKMANRVQGRPRKAGKKDTTLLLKISSTDKSLIRNKAGELGITLSSYLRRTALNQQIVVKTDLEMVRQIRKIGVNINQIAHKINMDSSDKNIYIGLAKLENYMNDLHDILEKIK